MARSSAAERVAPHATAIAIGIEKRESPNITSAITIAMQSVVTSFNPSLRARMNITNSPRARVYARA